MPGLTLNLLVPPLLVAFAAGGLMWVLAGSVAVPPISFGGQWLLALILWAASAMVTAAGIVQFRRARTTMNPTRPSTASCLVTGGVYRYTRNPMYVGLLLVLLGWAVVLESPRSLLAVVGFVLYLSRFQIMPEEQALERLFGADYLDYKRRSPRWLWPFG